MPEVTAATTTTTFLTLGDGDYTFSLDFARFLSSRQHMARAPATEDRATGHSHHEERIHLIATGFDSIDALTRKYRDTPFVLKQLQKLSSSEKFRVSVRHGVNAIQVPYQNSGNTQEKADYVIFNHPHLGTEDAQLHSKFLCHLFHAVERFWLRPDGGVFHLTLARGQFERWKCSEAADRHGMAMTDRCVFQAPLLPLEESFESSDGNIQQQPHNYYALRRHQTGKSFHSRAGQSEIFTFVRKQAAGHGSHDIQKIQPIAKPIWVLPQRASAIYGSSWEHQDDFHCPFCERTFQEERSVRAHMQTKHPHDGSQYKCQRSDAFVCPHCSGPKTASSNNDSDITAGSCESQQPTRSFVSLEALQDHIRAKHTGQHTNIKPDWYTSKQVSQTTENDSDDDPVGENYSGKCDVCGQVFRVDGERLNHHKLFEPVSGGDGAGAETTTPKESCRCRHCGKAFRERRAQLQHENFCEGFARN